jgi:hypothetical protein
MTSSKFFSVSAIDTFTPLPSAYPITVVHILNNSGVTLSFNRIGDPSAVFQLPTSMAWSFRGITNSAQLQISRSDGTSAPVVVFGELELEPNE